MIYTFWNDSACEVFLLLLPSVWEKMTMMLYNYNSSALSHDFTAGEENL